MKLDLQAKFERYTNGKLVNRTEEIIFYIIPYNIVIAEGELNPKDQPKLLDCTGLFCPMPILKVREALAHLKEGEALEVLADDPAAEEDIPNLIKRLNQQLLAIEKRDNGVIRFLIKRIK